MRTLTLRGATVDLATGAVDGDWPGRLTTRELTLLAWLAGRPGEAVSRTTLLTEAFGYSDAAVSRAVDKAMNSLREKVEINPANPDRLITVVGTGYRFVVPAGTTAEAPGLPAEVDGFVGRTGALAELRALLAEPGLVVILGPGGMGKTRLALALARQSVGARFVSLASARGREDVLGAVGACLNVPLTVTGLAPEEQLGRAIAALGPRILVLDDLEHLTAHAELIGLWRRLARRFRLLVTSRRPLGLAAERLYRLEPMSDGEGTELLVRRALQWGYRVEEAAVPELVRRLDGLPLALELAAARLGVLGVRDLLARLDDRLRLLRSRNPEFPGAPRDAHRGPRRLLVAARRRGADGARRAVGVRRRLRGGRRGGRAPAAAGRPGTAQSGGRAPRRVAAPPSLGGRQRPPRDARDGAAVRGRAPRGPRSGGARAGGGGLHRALRPARRGVKDGLGPEGAAKSGA